MSGQFAEKAWVESRGDVFYVEGPRMVGLAEQGPPLYGGLAFALDPIGFTHLRSELVDATDEALDVPLCFVAECRRSGATAAELNLTFDQAVEIDDFPSTDDRKRVSCPDCREWINA